MRWLVFHLGGQKWSVYIVSPKSKHLGKGTYNGACDYDTCKIYLSKSLTDGALEDTLLHELMHALMYVSGASKVYDCDFDKDETLVCAVTPMLHRLLRDLGFVFPSK